MISNFFEMPGFLKFLTGIALCNVIFIVTTLLPGSINIYGHIVTTKEWWSNGSGYISAISFLLLSTSGILMLKRAPYGRFINIVGWVASGISVLLAVKISNVKMPLNAGYAYAAFNVVSTVIFAIYLYFSKGARVYFGRIKR